MKRKKRRLWIVIAVIAVALLLIAAAALAFHIAGTAMAGRRQTLEEARDWQERHYDLSWYDPLEKEDYTVAGEGGYVLHTQLLKNPAAAGRFVIISHGYTDNRFGALKYASMYLDQGFNVVIYDLRGHGLNEPAPCTYTALERKDLLAVIRDTRERYAGITLLGLHGESLGAATSVAVLEEKPPVDFVVADCGFATIAQVLRGVVAMNHLPAFLVDVASVWSKIRCGYSYSQMRPVDSLKDNTVPILFIHGGNDSFILPENSEQMKNATKGPAEMHLIPNAAHAMSMIDQPETYRRYVADFLAEQFPERQ